MTNTNTSISIETVQTDSVVVDTLSINDLEADSSALKAVELTEEKDTILEFMMFDTLIYELGSISQGTIVKQRFNFTNTGSQDIHTINVVPDCSCTSPQWTEGAIAPGERGSILVTYDSKDDIGNFLKTITVLHDSGEGFTFLEMKGFVALKL